MLNNIISKDGVSNNGLVEQVQLVGGADYIDNILDPKGHFWSKSNPKEHLLDDDDDDDEVPTESDQTSVEDYQQGEQNLCRCQQKV